LNAVVFSRMATFALQNLSSMIPEFESWYKEKQAIMRADPLMKYFNELRRKIEHEAEAPGVKVAFSVFTPSMLGPAPSAAVASFAGDEYGRSGWMLRMPDGTFQKYFVDVPSVKAMLTLDDAPVSDDKQAATLAGIYLDRVAAVIAEAREKFVR
jgi:hypothetical protein